MQNVSRMLQTVAYYWYIDVGVWSTFNELILCKYYTYIFSFCYKDIKISNEIVFSYFKCATYTFIFNIFCHCKISYLCKGGKNPARLTSPNNPEAEEVAATSSSWGQSGRAANGWCCIFFNQWQWTHSIYNETRCNMRQFFVLHYFLI